MTPQPSSKPSRLAAIALAMVTVLSLTACTGHGAKDATATTRPVAADPVITWQGTTPTPPTDPRALALWSYMIEIAYAGNMKDFRRKQLADVATRSEIQGYINVTRKALERKDKGYDTYLGPIPVAIRKIDAKDKSHAIIAYCYSTGNGWWYGGTVPTRPTRGGGGECMRPNSFEVLMAGGASTVMQ